MEAKFPWVAPLGDDDMWSQFHLTEAVKILSEFRNAIAYFGQAVFVENSSRNVTCGFGTFVGLMHSPENYASPTLWDTENMLVESLLRTPLNMWSLVGKREEMTKAFEAFAESPEGYDSDRLMLWRLSTLGQIVVGREVSLFYRNHPDSNCNKFLRHDAAFHHKRSEEYSRMILREAEALGINVKEIWLHHWSRLSAVQKRTYLQHALPGAMLVAKEVASFEESQFSTALSTNHNKPKTLNLKRALLLLSPPLLIKAIQVLRRKLKQ